MSDSQLPKRSDQRSQPSAGARPHVTELLSTDQQVGRHVIAALQQEDTVAVLTAVVVGEDGTQRIVSAPLHQQALHEVRMLLNGASDQETQRVPCVGFHCYLPEPNTEPPPKPSRDDS